MATKRKSRSKVIDKNQPPRKRLKVDDMKVSQLKQEIKMNDPNKKISKLNKAELQLMLYKQRDQGWVREKELDSSSKKTTKKKTKKTTKKKTKKTTKKKTKTESNKKSTKATKKKAKNQKICSTQAERWNKLMQKHRLLKESMIPELNKEYELVSGEWVMKEEKQYLYINHCDDGYYGSFLIGPIEGKMKLELGGIGDDGIEFSFDWRGRETGENVIQIGGNKSGSITFTDCEADGILKSDLGNFTFNAFRVSSDVNMRASKHDFDYNEAELYEQERTSRWN
eukprot:325007_1